MIRAPSDIRCRSIPNSAINRKVIASTSGIDSATTVPVRSPRLRKETASTMTTASLNDDMNKLIDWSTISG